MKKLISSIIIMVLILIIVSTVTLASNTRTKSSTVGFSKINYNEQYNHSCKTSPNPNKTILNNTNRESNTRNLTNQVEQIHCRNYLINECQNYHSHSNPPITSSHRGHRHSHY